MSVFKCLTGLRKEGLWSWLMMAMVKIKAKKVILWWPPRKMLRYVYNNIVAALVLRATRRLFLLNKNSNLLSKTFLVLLRAANYGVWGHSVVKQKGGGGSVESPIWFCFFKKCYLSSRETFLYNKQKQHMSMSLNLLSRKWPFYKKLRKMTAYMRNMNRRPLGN